MRKTSTIAAGLIASLAFAGVAVAQNAAPSHTLDMSVSPSKAGKTQKPKTITKLLLGIENNKDSKTTASRIEIQFPKTVKINTKGFDTCSPTKIETDGAAACPKGSRLGKGTAGALVGPDQVPLTFTNEFYVGSSKSLAINLEQVGGDVKAVLIGKISKNTKGQKLTIDIPENLQQPAPGLFSALTTIDTSLKGTTGKGKKKHGIFQSTGCKGGSHEFTSTLTYVPNPNPPAASKSTSTDEVKCSK